MEVPSRSGRSRKHRTVPFVKDRPACFNEPGCGVSSLTLCAPIGRCRHGEPDQEFQTELCTKSKIILCYVGIRICCKITQHKLLTFCMSRSVNKPQVVVVFMQIRSHLRTHQSEDVHCSRSDFGSCSSVGPHLLLLGSHSFWIQVPVRV